MDSDKKFFRVECGDYTELLDRLLVVENYTNVTASAIFIDLVNKYAPSFTVEGVQEISPTVQEISFNYERLSDCFRELCEYIGWQWQVDYLKDLKFYNAETLLIPAPATLENGKIFTLKNHTINTQGLANRVFVLGGNMDSDDFVYEFVADGKKIVTGKQ